MRRALARTLAVLPLTAVVLAACEQSVTSVTNEARPGPQAVAPRVSVANGLPLGLTGNSDVGSFTVCSVGADATYNWSQPGWAAFTTFDNIQIPSDPGSSGVVTVANGGTTAPQAWASGTCKVVYSYPYVGHGGGFPVVTSAWQPQPGMRLDSIVKDSVKARDLTNFSGPLETDLTYKSTNSVSGVVNNDYGSIAFFYYTLLPSLQLVKLADAATVQAGQPIGFSMVVTNNGPGVANVVTLTDVLPTGSGLNWAVASPATGCAISAGTLTCSLGPLAAGLSATVHITSPTTSASCTSYSNTATAVADAQAGVQSTASTTVTCPPSLTLAKTADAASVSAGTAIGFTMTIANTGLGAAQNVTLSDPLPGGTGISWSISPASSACSISAGTLSCNFGVLAAGASVSVHVTSPTGAGSCGTYANTATAAATGLSPLTASASTTVTCSCGTYTIGYWKTHAGFGPQGDVLSPLLPQWLGTAGGARSVKVTTAAQAVSLLSMSGGASNPVVKLYAQMLAAKLNIQAGADGSAVASTISAADTFLATHDATSSLTGAEKNQVLAWMTTFDNYNNGIIGPGHCN